MKSEYFTLLLVIFLLTSSVCAKDIDDITDKDIENVNFFNENTIVDFDGINFTIPQGFGYLEGFDANESDENGTTFSKTYVNSTGGNIMITELYGKNIKLDLDTYKNVYPDTKSESINGIEGLSFKQDGYYYFLYINNDKVIILHSPDEYYFHVMINNQHIQ